MSAGLKGSGRQTRRCFASQHTYILVCMKVKLDTRHRDDAIKNLKQAVRGCEMPDPDVRVWGQDQVRGSPEPVSILGPAGKRSEYQ